MTDVAGAVMTEQRGGGSVASSNAYSFRGRVYTPEGTPVREVAESNMTSRLGSDGGGGVNIMLDVGVFCPCCAKTAENITVGGRVVSCNHVDVTHDDPFDSGENKAQFARRLKHFKELDSGVLSVDVHEPRSPRDEFLGNVSELNDMFRPVTSETTSPVSERCSFTSDVHDTKSSLSSPRTPDSIGGHSSATYASSICESLETSLRSINELADEWGCRGEEPLRPGLPAPSRRRFPSQEVATDNRPSNGRVRFSDDVVLRNRPRLNTASAADGVEIRRTGGAAYTANRRKRFSDDVTMFCYHKEPAIEPPSRNAMSVSPVEMLNRDDSDAGSISDESRALDELLAELTGTSSRKQRRTKDYRDRNANKPVLVPGARFNGNSGTPDVCQANLKRDARGQITSSNGGVSSHSVHGQRHVSYPASIGCKDVVGKRPVTSSRVGGPGHGMITIGDDENDELQEILSLSRTISSGCSNDILVEVIANALKRSVTREYSVTGSDGPEADIDTVLERADTEVFTGDVTLRRVFSVQREHSGRCTASHARQSSLSRLSAPHEDVVDGSAICGHCGFTVGCKRVCQNEAKHPDVVVQQKWAIKNNAIAARTDVLTTSPAAIHPDDVTRLDEAPHPVQDCKLETVRVEPAVAQKITNPDSTHICVSQTKVVESTIESEFEDALENVTDADSSFHADPSTDSPPAKPGTSETVEHWNNDFLKPSRPQHTSSCECIADDRSTRSGNDVDTDASGVQWSCEDTSDESDPDWAGYKGEKRGSFGQLIGDTLRMTEEILATFDHISCDDTGAVDGGETITREDEKSDVVLPRSDTPDLLRSKPDGQREAVDVPAANESVSKSNASVDRATGGHQELRREMFVANTEAESGECFFPYLEVIPPGPPMIQKAPYTIEPAPPIDEPSKREAIFNNFVKTGAAAVDPVVETQERGRKPEADVPLVQTVRDIGSEVMNELCVTTDEEPDLDALVKINTTSDITSTQQELGVITRDIAPESNSAMGGSDPATCSPKVKQKRKYVGARKRVDVAQFTQFRQADNEENGAAKKSVHFETQETEMESVEKAFHRNDNTAPPFHNKPELMNARVQQETVVDNVLPIVVERDSMRNAEMREVKWRDLEAEVPAPRIADKTEHHAVMIQQTDGDTATRHDTADDEWRTVLCEESSDLLADAGCDLQQATSQHGARYVYRASSTRGNTERFDEMKRRAGIDASSALKAAGERDSEEQVVSEELDIKKVTLLFTLPKEIRPIIPTRPPAQARGKKIIHIRRVTRINADGTTEVIQAPTARTIRYAPRDKAAVTAATVTVAPSGDGKRATTSEKPLVSATDATGKTVAHNAKITDTIPVEINMKYRHTKLRKYCKVAPLQRCSIEPPAASCVQETKQERCGAEQRLADKDGGKLVNGRVVGLWGTRLNGGEHSSDVASNSGVGNKPANGMGKDTKVVQSNASPTAPVAQNSSVAKTKPLPIVKPKPKIPSWLLAEISARPIDGGNNQDSHVSNNVAASTAGPAKQRQTTTAPSVLRRFKETTL